jgi:hypothetical protein
MKRGRPVVKNAFLDACLTPIEGLHPGQEASVLIRFPDISISFGHVCDLIGLAGCSVSTVIPEDDSMEMRVLIHPEKAIDVYVHVLSLINLMRQHKAGRDVIYEVVDAGRNIWAHLGLDLDLGKMTTSSGTHLKVTNLEYVVDRRARRINLIVTYSSGFAVRSAIGMVAGSQKTNDGVTVATFSAHVDQQGVEHSFANMLGISVERWMRVFTTPELRKAIDALNVKYQLRGPSKQACSQIQKLSLADLISYSQRCAASGPDPTPAISPWSTSLPSSPPKRLKLSKPQSARDQTPSPTSPFRAKKKVEETAGPKNASAGASVIKM